MTATKRTRTTTTDQTIGDLAQFDQRLYDDLPELAAAEQTHRRVALGMSRLRDALEGRDLAATVAKVIGDLADDGDPDAAVRALVDVAGLTAAADAMTAAAVIHLSAAEATVKQARTAAADTVLQRLDGTLGQLLDLTRTTLADMPGVDSADDAIAAGADAVTAWGRLQKLRDIHRAIRTAHRRVMIDIRPGMTALEPAHFARGAYQLDVPDYGADDGLALLRFLARRDVHAWVPTQAQLAADEQQQRNATKAAHAEAQQRVHALQGRPVRERELRQQRDILDYENSRGAGFKPLAHAAETRRR